MKIIHKYAPSGPKWMFACDPTMNFKTRGVEFRRMYASYYWKKVTCPHCLKLRVIK